MIYAKSIRNILSLILLLVLSGSAYGVDLEGTVRVGQVIVDEEGDRSVEQGSFNIYEGMAFSLENLKYNTASGIRVRGDFKNVTLNNRNITFGVSKSSTFGVTVRNNRYRRIYSSEGDSFTRRTRSSGDLWVQPHKYVRLYGGYGLTAKKGQMLELFEPGTAVGRDDVDYKHTFYNAGVRLTYQRYQLTAGYRGSSFKDDNFPIDDRTTGRFEITSAGPVPRLPQLFFNAGFQNFRTKIEDRNDTLLANTAWGGLRYFGPHQISVRTSFVFDRARRSGDLSATDNIAYSLHVGKDWQRYVGVVVGYRYQINDDVHDELNTTGYSFSVWTRPTAKLLVRGDYGSSTEEVTSGHTLSGDEEYSRFAGSIRYSLTEGSYARAKYASRKIENDEIGSSADFVQTGLELVGHSLKYGDANISYTLLDGDYVNTGGEFSFRDHLLLGDLMSPVYHNLQAGFGGTYMRGKEDVDIERSQLRFTCLFSFMEDHQISAVYRVFNYDDYADDSPIYSKYYTANIVEISIAKRL